MRVNGCVDILPEVDENWICVITYNVSATSMIHKCTNTADYYTCHFHMRMLVITEHGPLFSHKPL